MNLVELRNVVRGTVRGEAVDTSELDASTSAAVASWKEQHSIGGGYEPPMNPQMGWALPDRPELTGYEPPADPQAGWALPERPALSTYEPPADPQAGWALPERPGVSTFEPPMNPQLGWALPERPAEVAGK